MSNPSVSYASLYKRIEKEIIVIMTTQRQTEIPVLDVPVISFLVLKALIFFTVTNIKFGFRYSPVLNNINDLSLMAEKRHFSVDDFTKSGKRFINVLEFDFTKRFYVMFSILLVERISKIDTNTLIDGHLHKTRPW